MPPGRFSVGPHLPGRLLAVKIYQAFLVRRASDDPAVAIRRSQGKMQFLILVSVVVLSMVTAVGTASLVITLLIRLMSKLR